MRGSLAILPSNVISYGHLTWTGNGCNLDLPEFGPKPQPKGVMLRILRIGKTRYCLAGSDSAVSLAHSIGSAFIELQELEYLIIMYLQLLYGYKLDFDETFNLFSSKTFGNLITELRRYEFLQTTAENLVETKIDRDFFIHKYLFGRYGGAHMTTEAEYEVLIIEATKLQSKFMVAKTNLTDRMLSAAPILTAAAKFDPETGDVTFIESEFSKKSKKS